MPKVIGKAGETQEVSSAEYERLRQQAGDNPRSHFQTLADTDGAAGAGFIEAYDLVDGTRTRLPDQRFNSGPLRGRIIALERVVSVCTAPGCTYAGPYNDDVRRHIEERRQRKTQVKAHQNITAQSVTRGENTGLSCPGCGYSNFSNPDLVHRHIEERSVLDTSHDGAEIRTMKRYSLEPPAARPVAVPTLAAAAVSVLERDAGPGPVASQVSGSRRRRRRRRRKGGE